MIKLKQLLFCEEIDERDIFVRSSKTDGVSVMHRIAGAMQGSVVSIDNLGNGTWWVSRSLVNEERGKGIGSVLLKRAVQEVLKHEPNAKIIVEPGESYGSDEERQLNFYRKNGFVDVPNKKGVLMYNNKNLSEDIYKWEGKPGVPAEVVDAVQKIVKVVKRDLPHANLKGWVFISESDKLYMISKPIKYNIRHWMLSFEKETKKWQVHYVKNDVPYKSMDLNDQTALDYVINQWIKDVFKEP